MPKLHNVRALVTRPEPQANALAEAIVEQQGQAWVMSMIAIVPLPETQATKSLILSLDRYDHIIVTSRPAATLGLALIDQYWPQLPLHTQWYALGKSTAAELETFMIHAQCSSEGVDSEALLSLDALQHGSLHKSSGQKILIIKGEGGRSLLQEQLQARGAEVDTLSIYQRQRPDYPADLLVKQLESNRINVILCGSGETVTHLGHYLPKSNRANRLLVVPSERVARHALELGFQQVHNANGASNHAMLSALAGTILKSPEGPS